MKRALLALLLAAPCGMADARPPDERRYGPDDWHLAQPTERRLQANALARQELREMALRPSPHERQYAENRARCADAMRIAALCGTYAGMFTCDEKGFRPAGDGAARPPALDNGGKYRMQRCALEAARQAP